MDIYNVDGAPPRPPPAFFLNKFFTTQSDTHAAAVFGVVLSVKNMPILL